MYQRSSTYVMPRPSREALMKQAQWENGPLDLLGSAQIAEDDKDFKTIMDTGSALLAYVGVNQLIINGNIKLKSGSQIAAFTKTGSSSRTGELAADVVFATGLSDARNGVGKIFGDVFSKKCKRIWGLHEEGELHGA
ncbi:hypothetical protein DFH07DRAFT_1000894 [Mycena maculata]|uniref:Uncharacterized protein n=1 Tax=Mycena maculata TaxID=230809 RepID=A0AAD7JSW4_9AGAR|nr:hypothetical protein DFH07DRAFT_1000894 [Mycena maculata]